MTTIDLALENRLEAGWTVVDVTGEIDLHTAPTFRERVYELIDQGTTRILLNLSSLDFMDSTGLGVMIGSLKRLKERDGTLALAAPQHSVRRVLEVTGLTKIFPVYDTLEEAIGA